MAHLQLWTVHGDGKHLGPTDVVAPDERLAWNRTIGIGMQHVIAMFGATFLVPVLTGFPPTTTIFFSGVGTLIFIAMTIGRGQQLGLPSYTGSSFAFIVAGHRGADPRRHRASRSAASSRPAPCCSSSASCVDRFGSKWINVLMPPVVTGAVVALIGLNLAPVARSASSRQQALTAFVTLAAIVLFTVLLPGFFGRISILLGVILGYLVAVAAAPAAPLGELERGQVDRLPGLHGAALHAAGDRPDRSGGRGPARGEHGPHKGRRLDDRAQPRQVPRPWLHG